MKENKNKNKRRKGKKQSPTGIKSKASYLSFLRHKKISGKYLIMDDYGKWLFLDDKEYKLLKECKFEEDKNLLKRLKDDLLVIPKANFDEHIAKLSQRCMKKKNFLFTGPSLHIVIPTLRCDLKCLYCHASSKPIGSRGYDMDKKTAKKAVDLIFKSPSPNITIEFQGGEPLLNFGIIKFISEYARKKNKSEKKDLLLTIVTNLNNIDKTKLDYLLKNKISICTSFDGPSELHNMNRGCYNKLIKNIHMVNDEIRNNGIKNQRLNALLTVTKESLKYSKEIIDEYVMLGFKDIHIRMLNNLGNARNSGKLAYTSDEFIKFWKESMDYIIKLNLSGNHFIERKAQIILKKIFQEYDPDYMDLRSPCGAVIGQLVYNFDGKIFTCDEGRMISEDLFKIGTVDDEYKEITTSPTACSVIAASVNDTLYCDLCVYKPLCGVCPVLNYAENGSIISHIPGSSWCKVHMAQFDYIFEKLANDAEAKKVFLSWIETPSNQHKS